MEMINRLLKPLALSICLSLVMAGGVSAKAILPDFVELAKKLKPAVVNISTAKTIAPQKKSGRMQSPYGTDPFQEFFERFFENGPQHPMKQRSLGSGVIISDEGYVLTNYHVVSGADEIKVKLSGGREYKGELKGMDEKLDLALIKIEGKDHFPVATLGDSDKMQVGEWVMAIGNPFGLEQTVTAGIISATGRVIGSGPYDDFIQTDASINPGNSGGPLFNTQGEVIGINMAIVAGGQGIGFATPINMAKSVITQLREKGKVTRGWIGVAIQGVTPELAQSFGLEGEKGALVSDVMKNGPAEKAGIKTGDILLQYDQKEIRDVNQLPRMVAATPVGKKVPVLLLRNGKEISTTVTIEQLQEKEEETTALAPDKLGMTVRELTKEQAAQRGTGETTGVIVAEVKPGSIADEGGVVIGDVIKEINGTKITTIKDYEKAVSARKKGEVLRLLLRRGDNSLFVALKAG